MKFGIHLPQAGRHVSGAALLDVAQHAEARGFESLWLYDHLFTPAKQTTRYPGSADGIYRFPLDAPYLDCVACLGALAATTTRATIGTRVLLPLLRNPVVLSRELATIDEIAGGRLVLAVGSGWMPEEYVAAGVPFEGRGARLDEHVALMRALWSGAGRAFNGRFYQHAEGGFLPRPPRGTIPVLFGGHSDAALRRVARSGDGWAIMLPPASLSDPDATEGALKALRGRLETLARFCEEANRDPGELQLVAEAPFDAPRELFSGFERCGVSVCDLVTLRRPSVVSEQIDRFADEVGTEI